MKIRGLVVALFAVALSAIPQLVNTSSAASGAYSARLISPTARQVLYPGQVIRVEWRSVLPNINLGACEMEVWLSLDGGRTFTTLISPWMDPKAQYFYWTVPNMPTNAAVLDVRFGCEPGYPESYAPQPASTFVIAHSTGK
jgi:hypothetical protein